MISGTHTSILRKLLQIIVTLFAVPTLAWATTYTVKTSGGDYTNPVTCANAVIAGDICEVYDGVTGGGTITNSGTAGNPITIQAAAGQTSAISSNILFGSGVGWVVVSGLTTNGASIQSSSVTTGLVNHHIIIKDNWIDKNDGSIGINIWCDNCLISGNTFDDIDDDTIRIFGSYNIIRNNIVEDEDEDTLDSNVHMDFIQGFCVSGQETAQYLLVEGNRIVDYRGSDAHFFLVNATTGCGIPPDHYIIRRNIAARIGQQNINVDSNGQQSGGHHNKMYNNTIVLIGQGTHPTWFDYSATVDGIDYNAYINNLNYDAMDPTGATGVYNPGTGYVGDYNLYYDPDYTMTFGSPASSEANKVANQDPLFASLASNNYNLTSPASPAIDAGGPLTAVAVADTSSGTSLILDDAAFFQDGWEITNGDCIAVGTVSNTTCITAVNYSTNTLTINPAISRNDSDSVWLYSGSDGVRVLYGSAPDIGALEYGSGDTTAPACTISTGDPQAVSSDSVTLQGTCTDAVGVTAVKARVSSAPDASNGSSCTCDDAACDGTSEAFTCVFSGLSEGANTVYVGAGDAAANWSTGGSADSITVNYTIASAVHSVGPGTVHSIGPGTVNVCAP